MHKCRTINLTTQFKPFAEQLVICSDCNRSLDLNGLDISTGTFGYQSDQSLFMNNVD